MSRTSAPSPRPCGAVDRDRGSTGRPSGPAAGTRPMTVPGRSTWCVDPHISGTRAAPHVRADHGERDSAW